MSEVIFTDPKDYLILEFQLRKNRRAGYSYRAFARDLQFSPSSLNDFMKGRVGMSESRIEKLAAKLNWSQQRTDFFKDLIYSKFGKDKAAKAACKMKVKLLSKDKNSYLSLDQFRVISQWYSVVIVELLEMNDHLGAKEISENLKISMPEVNAAIKNLIKIDAISLTEKGLKPTSHLRQAGDESPSDAIKNFHHQILQQAQLALYNKPLDDRDSHSLVFSIRDADKEKMNAEIRKSLYLIVNKYAADIVPDSVQIITFQSFQVYKKNK